MPDGATPRPAAAGVVDDHLITALARDFATRAERHDRDASFPFENLPPLLDAGLPALLVPAALGGRGRGLGDALRVVRGIAVGEPSTALVLALQYLFHGAMFRNPDWSPALRERIARTAVTDGALVNVLRVEPDLGTPLRGGLPATTARRVPGGWSLSGTKIYSTGSPALTWFGVWARTEDAEPLVGTWVVPAGTPGLEVRETWNHLGLRASGSHEVVLTDVVVPDDHAADIRPAAAWTVPDPRAVAAVAVLFSAVYDGVARAARDWLLGFLKERAPSNLGAPLATVPRLQEAVGAIEERLHTNRVLLDALAAAADAGTPPPASESLLTKYTVTNNAIDAVAKALEITGNPGLSRDNPLQRHHRDVLCARVHAPQNDTILTGAGRAALGI